MRRFTHVEDWYFIGVKIPVSGAPQPRTFSCLHLTIFHAVPEMHCIYVPHLIVNEVRCVCAVEWNGLEFGNRTVNSARPIGVTVAVSTGAVACAKWLRICHLWQE